MEMFLWIALLFAFVLAMIAINRWRVRNLEDYRFQSERFRFQPPQHPMCRCFLMKDPKE